MLTNISPIYNALNKTIECNTSFTNDVLTPYIICALVLKAKQSNISLNKSSEGLVKELYGNDSPSIVNEINIDDFSSFEEISIEDLKNFLSDYQSALYSIGKRAAEIFVPEKIISLICKLLELTDADILDMFGEACPVSALQITENYSVVDIYAYSLQYRIKEFAELLSDALGYKVKFIEGEYYLFDYIERANKVISFPMWNCSTIKTAMGTYLEGKGFKPTHNNSTEAGVLFAMDALAEDGLAAVCVPLNLVQKADNPILKDIIVKQQLKAVVALPGGLFPSTDIKTALLILSKKKNDSVRFVNGTEFFTKNRKLRNELSDTNIMEITNAYFNNSEYAKNVKTQEIIEKNYSLNYINYFIRPEIVIAGIGRNKYPSVKIADVLLAKPIRGTLIPSEVLDSEASNSSYRYLTAKNIIDNEIDFSLLEIPEQEKRVDKYCLKENDIILSVVTNDVIKVAIAQNIGDLHIVVSNMLYKLTPDSKKIRPLFLKAILSNPAASRVFKAYSSGSSISTLTIDVLCNTEITLPSLDKQDIFVKNYEELMNTRCMLIEQIRMIDKSKDLLFVKTFQEE